MNTTTNTQNQNDFDANQNLNVMPNKDQNVGMDATKSDDKMDAANLVTQDGSNSAGNTDDSAAMKDLKEKKEQLHRRVMERISDLEGQLNTLQGTAKDSEHAKALQNEISLANDMMSGGWDHVGEMEAARLSQWLDNGQHLMSKPDPASGEPMNTRLPADGAVATDGKLEASRPKTNMS